MRERPSRILRSGPARLIMNNFTDRAARRYLTGSRRKLDRLNGIEGRSRVAKSDRMKNVPARGSLSIRPAPEAKRRSSRSARLKDREEWLRRIDPAFLFHRLFDLIPGLSFFAKNRAGEMMFASRNILDRYHLGNEIDIVGLTDFDLSPPDMARAHVMDDEQVYASGQPILNRIELGFDDAGVPDWFVVNKLPVRGYDGTIIGVMGFYQSYQGREKMHPHYDVAKAVEYVRQHFEDPINIGELARLAGLSVRQLQRKFKSAFATGPHEFLTRTRLLAACRLLRDTDLSAGEIASKCGFSDQSSFTKHFRGHIGETPRRYRHAMRAKLATGRAKI
jgi:AraC-like DNA-binding protein